MYKADQEKEPHQRYIHSFDFLPNRTPASAVITTFETALLECVEWVRSMDQDTTFKRMKAGLLNEYELTAYFLPLNHCKFNSISSVVIKPAELPQCLPLVVSTWTPRTRRRLNLCGIKFTKPSSRRLAKSWRSKRGTPRVGLSQFPVIWKRLRGLEWLGPS